MSIDRYLFKTAKVFYDDAKSQLEQTRHFGLLGDSLAKARDVTRAHYVQKHCEQLFNLKKVVPGLGLGTHIKFPEPKDNRADWAPMKNGAITGLELCQSWAVLLNAGHLWGTFATERGLLFQLDKDLGERERFIVLSVEFDKSRGNGLRSIFENALDAAHLHRFFYLIAFWRLRNEGISNLIGDDRLRAQLLLKAFIMAPTPQIKRMVDIFKKTRQLTYLRMHNDLDESKYSVQNVNDHDLQKLFPADALPEADSSSQAHWNVLEAIDKRDATEIFGNVTADAQVLAHAESFKIWWKIQVEKKASIEKRVDALFSNPVNWPKHSIPKHKHFIELRIPTRVGWLTEVRLWLRNDQKRDPWSGSNFLITPTPHETMLYVDVYGGASGLPVRVLKHVVTQLTRPFQCTHDLTQSRALWMSSARLIARAFEASLKPGFSLRLSPITAIEGHTGYACVGHTYEFVRGLAKSFLPLCADSQRAIELRQTITIADNMGHWRSPAMLLLAKAEILDDKTSNVITDVDGLLGLFVGKELHWLIVETKAGVQNGQKQLQRGLGRALIDPLPHVNKLSVREQKVWYFEIKSPLLLT